MATEDTNSAAVDMKNAVTDWLAIFADALNRGDTTAAANLFLEDGHWRDILAFTWHLNTMSGARTIEKVMQQNLDSVRPSEFRLASGRTAPRHVVRAGTQAIEAIFEFKTAFGRGSGVLRLVPDPDANGAM